MIRGWCPSLHEPMASGDGLLVRVKPPLGRLTAAAARALASAALACGNGAIELTGRAALQFRGLTPESAARFAEIAVGLGLAHADPAVERRRSILVDPFADTGALDVAQALEAAIVADHALASLPAKFGFAVDVGGADISLVLGGDRCMVVPDGAGQAAVVALHEAVPAVLRVAHAFLALAGSARRMRSVAPDVFALAGLTPVPFVTPAARVAIGPVQGMFGVGLPFGAMDAGIFAALADLAGGELRLTPWRAIVLPGAPDPAALAALGLIVSPDDPLLRVSACPGQPGCASATVRTRDLAARLRPGVDVHVSGCSKGCAHPGAAALTLVGREGRFDVVRLGRAGDIPAQRGLTPAEVMQLQ